MAVIHSVTKTIDMDAIGIYCGLEKSYKDQFAYIDESLEIRLFGFGCLLECESVPAEYESNKGVAPYFFSCNSFDPDDSKERDELFKNLESDMYILPEITLIERNGTMMIQKNSVDDYASIDMKLPFKDYASSKIDYEVSLDDRDSWISDVERILKHIKTGDVEKVVLSRRLELSSEKGFSASQMLINLIVSKVNGTIFLYKRGDVFFIGATPEHLITKNGKNVSTTCIAGTAPCGADETEKRRFAEALLNDGKNLREHNYVMKYLIGIFSETCTSVSITENPSILSLDHVQHLYTPVTGEISAGITLHELRSMIHPTPALAGTPKDKAMELIRETEGYNRGLYGGTFGYTDSNGNGSYSVAIRSGVFSGRRGYVFAGCGIVSDSNPKEEYDEVDMKLRTIYIALDGNI